MSLTAVLFTLGCSDALFYAFVDDDKDGDGIYDLKDNCLNTANPEQKDTDGDSIGDACDDKNDNGEVVKLNLSVDPSINGTITSIPEGINCGADGDGTCTANLDYGTEVTLTAKADTGYVPGAWQGNCDKTDADQPCKLTMDADKNVSKAFTITQRSLSITLPTKGTITHTDSGINCGADGDGTCTANLDYGTEVTLTATADTGYAPAAWQGNCAKTDSDEVCRLSMDTNKTVSKIFSLLDSDGDGEPDATDVDDDNDGLVEVHNLEMFDHIQHNLAGTSYKTASGGAGGQGGAPTATTADCTTDVDGDGFFLCGYELMRDLDFANKGSYGAGTVNNAWRPLDVSKNVVGADSAVNEGFTGPNRFAGIFEGNGYKISNLYSRGSGSRGLFKSTNPTASIRNLGVVNANLYMGSGSNQSIGGLVGLNQGSISASSATGGTVNGGADDDTVGSLVGWNQGDIIASYATGATNGGAGNDYVGGLVGYNEKVSITASYATGAVDGGAGYDFVGGLVGWNQGDIIASYAAGATNGGTWDDNVGGLVGYMASGTNTITASYATGAANGGAGSDNVGGLVGIMFNGTNTITASYATGTPDGGNVAGTDDVGALVGEVAARGANTITHSYGFGSLAGLGTPGNAGTTRPLGVSDANGLTATNVNTKWDDAGEKTKDAWDFGTTSQAPALKYADYDGDMAGTDYCALFPTKIPGTDTDLACGTSLLPDQPGR